MISLITATYGRTKEVRTLLDSLTKQSYKDFEFILIDQNSHSILQELIAEYTSLLNIKYIRSDIKGLSYNRNIGLEHSCGNIIGFPDDDCFYENDVLEKISDTFQKQEDIILVATALKDATSGKIWKTFRNAQISRLGSLKYCSSNNIFVRRTPIRFDINLGVGAYWGSGEESDYLWEMFKKADVGVFLRNTYINHPYITESLSNTKKAYSYGLGFGALFKKEIIYRKHYSQLFFFLYYILRSIGGCLISKHKAYYYNTLRGRLKGFFTFPI